ncbi:MAG: hypothetical protein AAF191_15310 [Verrucomicrobiota bacterium]
MSYWIGTSLWSLGQEAEVIVPSMDDAKALVADVIAEEAGEEVQKLAEGILDLLEKISQEEGERDAYREKASTARGEVDSYREAAGELLEGAEDVIELDEGGETDPEAACGANHTLALTRSCQERLDDIDFDTDI